MGLDFLFVYLRIEFSWSTCCFEFFRGGKRIARDLAKLCGVKSSNRACLFEKLVCLFGPVFYNKVDGSQVIVMNDNTME